MVTNNPSRAANFIHWALDIRTRFCAGLELGGTAILDLGSYHICLIHLQVKMVQPIDNQSGRRTLPTGHQCAGCSVKQYMVTTAIRLSHANIDSPTTSCCLRRQACLGSQVLAGLVDFGERSSPAAVLPHVEVAMVAASRNHAMHLPCNRGGAAGHRVAETA